MGHPHWADWAKWPGQLADSIRVLLTLFHEQHRTRRQEADLVTQTSPAGGDVVWINARRCRDDEIGLHFGRAANDRRGAVTIDDFRMAGHLAIFQDASQAVEVFSRCLV